MKKGLSTEEKAQLAGAISAAEKATGVELLTVLAARSDDYRFIPLLWAALAALALPAVLMLTGVAMTPENSYLAQLALFLVVAALARVERIKMRMVPRRVAHTRASHFARSHFMRSDYQGRSARPALMFFVSEAERYVEIVTDAAVAAKVPDSAWQSVVQEFVTHVKAGETLRGYLVGVERISELLGEHFPVDSAAPDQLPNTLIEI